MTDEPKQHHIAAGLLVSAIALVAYLSTAQGAYWSDGRFLIGLVDEAEYRYHHIAYLPLSNILRWLAPSAVSTKALLIALSTAATAIGVLVVAVGIARLTRSFLASILAGLALVASPPVWFFATCAEVHALQFLVACVATSWICAREGAKASGPLNLVVPTLLLGLMTSTHMVGALWGPALAWYVFREHRRGASLRHPLAALGVAIAMAWIWFAINSDARAGSGHTTLAFRSLLGRLHPMLMWREIGQPQFVMLLLASALLLVRFISRRERSSREGSAFLFGGLALAALGTFAPFCIALDIAEQGAYFYSTTPLLAACAACLLSALPARGALLIGALAIAAAGYQSLVQLHDWEYRYPGHEWAEPLFREASPFDLVLSLTEEEGSAVFRHSDLKVIGPYTGAIPLDASDPAIRKMALFLIKRRFDRGDRVFVTREFFASDDPGIRALVGALSSQFAASGIARPAGYHVFSSQSTPPNPGSSEG